MDTMSKRHQSLEGITWKQADIRQMDQIPSRAVDIAFDKGTLDAMIHGSPWDPPDEVLDNTGRYIREVRSQRDLHSATIMKILISHVFQAFRVLKSDGILMYVTYRQPHFIKPLLNCEGVKWNIELDVLGGNDSSFAYHGYVLKKAWS